MNGSLSQMWEEFIANQVASGEFGNASEVVREALRLLREQQQDRALEQMRNAFAQVDAHGGKGEPTAADRALIDRLIRQHRKSKRKTG